MKLYKIREVAEILGTNKQRVYQLIKSKHLTALKLGDLKVSNYELERFIIEANGKDFSDLDNVKELVVQVKEKDFKEESNLKLQVIDKITNAIIYQGQYDEIDIIVDMYGYDYKYQLIKEEN